ncbi:MAG: hypothetical protein II598_01180 [Elusimicrobia bacterium]|nr:hypothetical protein [Lachnospiraceae bacterium]MBQ4178337.1 hypothetical protein [Elusimicrobiota bacterium]
MKIKNIGTASFIVRDIRGNMISLEPNCSIEVEDKLGVKLKRVYDFIQEVAVQKEVKEEVKVDEKPVDVPRETKKKRKK